MNAIQNIKQRSRSEYITRAKRVEYLNDRSDVFNSETGGSNCVPHFLQNRDLSSFAEAPHFGHTLDIDSHAMKLVFSILEIIELI